MPIIAGIDEAGYGPKIGPFVLSSVVMDIPAKHHNEANIWHIFEDAVSDKIRKRGNRIVVNDSKKIYSQKSGLRLLEETVLSFIWSTKGKVTRFSDLLKILSNYNEEVFDKYPWYKGKDLDLPIASNVSAILNYADLIKHTISSQDANILDVKSIFLCAYEINRQIGFMGNKSLLLFDNSVKFLKEIFECFGDREPKVLIDKHGGRNYYHKLLAESFEGCDVKAVSEGNPISTYKISNGRRKMNVSFAEGADSKHFPPALASMFSKYIRELFIRLFNAYWQEKVQDIKPTAGYPEDAKRFLSQIQNTKNKLGISDDILIRVK
jgi:ribonuclease HII